MPKSLLYNTLSTIINVENSVINRISGITFFSGESSKFLASDGKYYHVNNVESPNDSQIKMKVGTGSITNEFTLNQASDYQIDIPSATSSIQGVVKISHTLADDPNTVLTNRDVALLSSKIEFVLAEAQIGIAPFSWREGWENDYPWGPEPDEPPITPPISSWKSNSKLYATFDGVTYELTKYVISPEVIEYTGSNNVNISQYIDGNGVSWSGQPPYGPGITGSGTSITADTDPCTLSWASIVGLPLTISLSWTPN